MKEKKEVQEFYDQVGWQKVGHELFADAQEFEDLRPVSKDYIHKCHLRVNRYLKHKGKYFLDVASGPIQYPEYLSYSQEFDSRICVDISILALKEARVKLGNNGVYLLADITNLPFKDNSVDAVLSLHTIYHVPASEQSTALCEIYRVLKPGSSAVVVYSWGWGSHSLLMNWICRYPQITKVLKASIARMLGKRNRGCHVKFSQTPSPRLYFYAHDYKYFARQRWGFNINILVWRSVSPQFTKKYIHSWFLGKQALALIYWLEDRLPYVAGRLGKYPLFIVEKRPEQHEERIQPITQD